MVEPYALQHVLWDLRHDVEFVHKLHKNPTAALEPYGLSDAERDALLNQDFRKLLDSGVNPLLLYFGALEMGISRVRYYEILNASQTTSQNQGGSQNG